jgi:hypothetical protein
MPAHPVDRVEFRGMLGTDENDLRRAVEDRFGEIPRAAQVDNVVTLLRTLYRDRGIPRPRSPARSCRATSPIARRW